MKNIIYIIILAIASTSYAQDPQLLDTDWNLIEIVKEQETIIPPSTSFLSQALFVNTNIDVVHQLCQDAFSSELNYINSNEFDILPETIVGLVGSCGDPEIIEFMVNHYGFYGLDNGSPLNPFSYEITSSGDELTLVITNGNGDVATYGNFTLSLSENVFASTKLIYNAEHEYISFLRLEQETFLSIYDLNGQKLLDATISSSEIVDVSVLPKGIYFATMSNSNNSRSSKKFVKF